MAPPEIRYRPFLNTDPPWLAEIWRARNQERGLMQPMSAALFEQLVLSKTYFDREGLILAVDGARPVGFVHAGFGPTDDEARLTHQLGVTCMLMVRHDYRRLGIGSGLLAQSEAYLQARGAQVLYGGGIRPLNPFYLGLYGGSELPGVLNSDAEAQRLYLGAGYREIDRALVLHRELASFRPPVNRQQMQIRRGTRLDVRHDLVSASWWEASTMGGFERTRYELLPQAGGPPAAAATVWAMEPLATTWGVKAAGLIDLAVEEPQRRQGLATFLLSEVFRQLHAEGVALVEVQTMQANRAARALYNKLGFDEVDQGAVYRKS